MEDNFLMNSKPSCLIGGTCYATHALKWPYVKNTRYNVIVLVLSTVSVKLWENLDEENVTKKLNFNFNSSFK